MLVSSFRSGNFEISIYNSFDSDVAVRWKDLPSDSLNSGYLTFIEKTNPHDLEFRYIIIEKSTNGKNETSAILYFQLLKFTKRNINFSNSFFLSMLSAIVLSIRPIRILICGNIFAVNFPSIRYDRNKITPVNVLEILSAIGEREKSDVYFLKDMDKEFSLAETEKFGWNKYSADMTMCLKEINEWNSMDDYIDSLTKKYKKRAEKIRATGAVMERKELSADDILFNSERIQNIFNQVASKQTVRMGLIGMNYFYEFKKQFKEFFTFIGYYYKNQLVAFSTYIDHGKTLEIHYIGIDYAYNKDLLIYFNILQDGVDRAIIGKKEQLELGRTAREAKANLGGNPEYFNDFIKINGRFIESLTKRFSKYFQAEIGERWQEKHPFRK